MNINEVIEALEGLSLEALEELYSNLGAEISSRYYARTFQAAGVPIPEGCRI